MHGDVSYIRAPHGVGLRNSESSQEIGVDRMFGMRFGEAWFPIERFYVHLPHESTHVAPADLMPFVPQFVPYASRAEVGVVEVYLIDEAHQFPVLVAHQHRDVIDARPGEVEYAALCRQWQRMLPDNHFFALDPSMRPSATAKKSFSIASWPIFAWSSFTSGSLDGLPLSKISDALSRSCFFHSAIWLGWTWKRSANSTSVCSPLMASRATFALNTAP